MRCGVCAKDGWHGRVVRANIHRPNFFRAGVDKVFFRGGAPQEFSGNDRQSGAAVPWSFRAPNLAQNSYLIELFQVSRYVKQMGGW